MSPSFILQKFPKSHPGVMQSRTNGSNRNVEHFCYLFVIQSVYGTQHRHDTGSEPIHRIGRCTPIYANSSGYRDDTHDCSQWRYQEGNKCTKSNRASNFSLLQSNPVRSGDFHTLFILVQGMSLLPISLNYGWCVVFALSSIGFAAISPSTNSMLEIYSRFLAL